MEEIDAAFVGEVAGLERALDRDRERAVSRLRAVHERWARAILGVPPAEDLVEGVRRAVEGGVAAKAAERALSALAQAERWQWEIGSWSTGAGEGLASMFEVRSLQLARAWLIFIASPTDEARERARSLAREVLDDPNRIAERRRPAVDALLRTLDA